MRRGGGYLVKCCGVAPQLAMGNVHWEMDTTLCVPNSPKQSENNLALTGNAFSFSTVEPAAAVSHALY